MSLRFPNARLYLHELLTLEGLSGAQAIARAACDFGLIPSDSSLELPNLESEECTCLRAFKKVLERCLEEKARQQARSPVDVNEAWLDIEKLAKTHIESTSCAVLSTAEKPGCIRLVPIVFDLLLQQIGRYY
jgi:hypothetical protein